jgi:hypothetical protein
MHFQMASASPLTERGGFHADSAAYLLAGDINRQKLTPK